MVEALVLVRGMLPDLTVRPGTLLHGRVVDQRTLMLEGVRLQAKLPEGVVEGELLRLRVEESGLERLHLRVVERPQPEQAAQQSQPAAPPVAVPLPGGATLTVLPDGGKDGEGARRSGDGGAVTVRFDSPALGRLDIRLDGHAAAVHVSAGDPSEAVRAAAPELGAALAGVAGRPVQVTVHPRVRTLDASA